MPRPSNGRARPALHLAGGGPAEVAPQHDATTTLPTGGQIPFTILPLPTLGPVFPGRVG